MPLTRAGKKTKAAFIKEYGKKKGEEYFYRYENKHKGLKKDASKKKSSKKRRKRKKAR